jgi:hypothetical protein
MQHPWNPAPADRDRINYVKRRAAYLRGQGAKPPDPPCPDGVDPMSWSVRMHARAIVAAWHRRELREGKYPQTASAQVRREADRSWRAVQNLLDDVDAAGIGNVSQDEADVELGSVEVASSDGVSLRPSWTCWR